MIERMERLSRSGDKDAARQLLEQLQQMLENLQMAQPGQSGDGDMEQALNELGDMIRKQQQLRDKTFKQGQDSRRDRMRGKQGDQSMGDLQQDQQGLRDRLKKLQQELAKRGMGQGQRGEKGQRGEQGQQGQQGQQGSRARTAIRRRRGRPRRSRYRDGRCRRQARRGQRRRRGGFAGPGAGCAAQGRPEPRGGDAAGRRRRPGRRPGQSRRPAAERRPIRPIRSDGRCTGANSATITTVKIPGEIDVQRVRRILEELRRRLADPQRPQIELDYIERLLKDY